VQAFGEGLGETVAERADHERIVVVVLGLEFLGECVDFGAGGDRKASDAVDTTL
jgi:hypothetical protein